MSDPADPADPFGTAALRESVLAGWASSPTRLREDTAVEADLVHGGYRDRLLTELAQNAHDAALRAGVAGRLVVTLVDGALHVGNTGAPLDRAGVEALASLRASGKGGASVGRYGVGFTSVLAVTDAPEVRSTTGSIMFSHNRTRAAIGSAAAVPVLRLPWPTGAAPDPGLDTEVVLPLRAGIDGPELLAQLAADVPELLLELPALGEIVVAGSATHRTEVDLGGRRAELTLHSTGPDRTWLRVGDAQVAWLVATRDGEVVAGGDDVLRAPTRTDEELSLPARLVLDAPLAPDRRRLLPGAAAVAAIDTAAARYPELVAAVPAAARTRLVPTPAFPRSAVDERLREGVLTSLRSGSWLPAATGDDLAPTRAVVLDEATPELVALLVDVLPGLLVAELSAPPHAAALAAVGVTRLRLADLADTLAGVGRAPSWWRALYAEIDALPGTARNLSELASLPVPLTDGRAVLGPRSVLLVEGSAAVPAIPGLRVVHPDAVHPLLRRLGARSVGPGELLADDLVRAAVTEADESDLPAAQELADSVLALVALARPAPGELAWLGSLLLPDDSGELRAADELLLPGAPLAAVLAEDTPFGVLAAGVLDRHGPEVLRVVGVGWGFGVVRDEDPAGPDHDLDGEDEWWADVLAADDSGPTLVLAVRDLDLVDPASWPRALRLLAEEPETLAAARLPGGHTAWWLGRGAQLAGQRVGELRAPDDRTFAGLLDPVPAEHAAVLAAALARPVLGSPAGALLLLDRLADPARRPDLATTARVHALLGAAVADGLLDPADVDPPERVRTADGAARDAGDAVILDDPWLAPLLPAARTVVTAGAADPLAELLDLDVASADAAVGGAVVVTAGRPVAWVDDAATVLRCAALGVAVPEGVLHRHEELRVRTAAGVELALDWWVDDEGTVSAGPAGAADALLHVLRGAS